MAKVKKSKQKKQTEPTYTYDNQLGRIRDFFPEVSITKHSDIDPRHYGRDFVTEVILPKQYTLKSKSISAKGEVLSISFSIQAKHCSENQKPGIYTFSA